MSQDNPHPSYASGLQGADSLSYSHSSLGTSTSSGLPSYEQRAQSSGLVDRQPTDATTSTPTTTTTTTSTASHRNPDGTVPTAAAGPPAGTPHGDDAAPRVSPAGQDQAKAGDSKTGRLMEKAGVKLHSAKLAEKGEAKRERAANA